MLALSLSALATSCPVIRVSAYPRHGGTFACILQRDTVLDVRAPRTAPD